MPKTSKIRVFIYRIDIYNLQTKIVLFPDQDKLLKEVVLSLEDFMNANIKNFQIKHCSCSKYVVISRPNLYNLQARRNIWKMIKIYLFFLKLKHVKRLQICLSLMLKLLEMSEICFAI